MPVENPTNYIDLIAEFEVNMKILGYCWGWPPVSSWCRSLGRPNRHFLSSDDYEILIERSAIALADRGVASG
jgi:hypothetical protein